MLTAMPGVIKGSEGTLSSENGMLDEDAYLALSHRQGSFAHNRDIIYALFGLYTKMKAERREWDAADRYVTGIYSVS